MSQPTTGIGFSASTPVAPAGYQIAQPQTDGAQPLSKFDFVTPNTGGAAVKTASYTAAASDCGKLLSFADSSPVSAHTLTLPPTPPFAQWQIAVQNTGTSPLTIALTVTSPVSSLLDGSLSSLVLAAGSGLALFTDGTNYFTERGDGVSISAIQQEAFTYAADTGAVNAYAVTLSPAPTIVAGSEIVFKAANANTGASTVAVNGGAATPIKKNGAAALAAGDIAAGQIVALVYDGSNWQIAAPGGVVTSLTTTGSSGAATLLAGVLNIPQYSGGGGGGSGLFAGLLTIPTVAGLNLPTAYNQQGSLVIANKTTGVGFSDTANYGGIEGLLETYPGSPFTATMLASITANGQTFQQTLSFCAANTTSGKVMIFGPVYRNNGRTGWQFRVATFSAPATFVSDSSYVDVYPYNYWLRYKDDGTNITISMSTDGVFWQPVYGPVTKASTYLGGSGFNYFGLIISPSSPGVSSMLMSYTLTTP